MKIRIIVFILFSFMPSSIILPQSNWGQKVIENMHKKNEENRQEAERQQRQLELERIREYQRQQYEVQVASEVAKIDLRVSELKRETQEVFNNLDVLQFRNTEIVKAFSEIEKSCNDKIAQYWNNRSNSVLSANTALNYIREAVNQVLSSPKFRFIVKMIDEKKKMDNFLALNKLSDNMIRLIMARYEDFLLEPFKQDADGNYIGFSFDETSMSKKLSTTGTAFAVTPEGFLLTNFHVIQYADEIKVRKNTDEYFSEFSATVYMKDSINDLAILKIMDNNYKPAKSLPYSLVSRSSDLGEEVFVLGYPLPTTMGLEMKLTNGIISSKSGFQGDPTTYQISAPVQPGNSGGPLFDKGGNIIGIVTAKHLGTENVSYAVKGKLLGDFIKSARLSTKNNVNRIAKKKLSQMIKEIQPFVFMVLVN